MSGDSSHGGPRDGAGRPFSEDTMTREVKVRMSEEIYEYVTQVANQWRVPRPEAVRRILRRHIDTNPRSK